MLFTRIRHLRHEHGWTQQQLADISYVSKGTIKNIETGEYTPAGPTREKLAAAFGLPSLSELDTDDAAIADGPATTRPPAQATRIRFLRTQRGWTQEQLADASGVSKEAIKRIEGARSFPSGVTLGRLAAGFELPVADLFTRAEQEFDRRLSGGVE